jgi:plasmid stabilization system protein ParE
MTYRFTSAANKELESALQFYEQAQAGLGSKFLDELSATIDRVLAMPEAWKLISSRTRRCLFHRFPFGIIYRIRDDEILIVAVADLRRDPQKWEDLK